MTIDLGLPQDTDQEVPEDDPSQTLANALPLPQLNQRRSFSRDDESDSKGNN